MRFKSLIVAVVVSAALAGCQAGSGTATGSGAKPASAGTANGGGGSSTATGGGAIDPCSLITTSQATAVLGTPVKDGAPHAFQNTKQCQWDAASGPADGSIAILVYIGGQQSQWSSTVNLAKASPKFSEVQGLGDAAFSNGFDLHILKGDNMYQIGVAGPFQNTVERATTVAKEALANV